MWLHPPTTVRAISGLTQAQPRRPGDLAEDFLRRDADRPLPLEIVQATIPFPTLRVYKRHCSIGLAQAPPQFLDEAETLLGAQPIYVDQEALCHSAKLASSREPRPDFPSVARRWLTTKLNRAVLWRRLKRPDSHHRRPRHLLGFRLAWKHATTTTRSPITR